MSMDNAIIQGTVREEVFIDDKPEHNLYIIEIVTKKRKSKNWLMFDREEIQTKEIILKNCLWCQKVLS
jgi:hypothetical protein